MNRIFFLGYGSALTSEKEVEMDAAIMNGNTMELGAVTGAKDIFHPISLARRVMDKTPYNFLSGKGAMNLAVAEGFQILPPHTLVKRIID